MSETPEIVTKSDVVQAFQLTKERRNDLSVWPYWLQASLLKSSSDAGALLIANDGSFELSVLGGSKHPVNWGDYITFHSDGSLYVVDNATFLASYESCSGGFKPRAAFGTLSGFSDFESQRKNHFGVIFPLIDNSFVSLEDVKTLEIAVYQVSPLSLEWKPERGSEPSVKNVTFKFRDFIGRNTSKSLLRFLYYLKMKDIPSTNLILIEYSADGFNERMWLLEDIAPVHYASQGQNADTGVYKNIFAEFSVQSFRQFTNAESELLREKRNEGVAY